MQNDVVIEQNAVKNENQEKKEVEKEDMIPNNIEQNKIINATSTEIETEPKNENEISNTSPNINDNNIIENIKSPINRKENTNLNENIQHHIVNTERKSDKGLIEKILEDEGEYTPIENILHGEQNKNDIVKNNQIYFTEANSLITRNQSDIHKSSSNKLYILTSIPEYTKVTVTKKAETPMKTNTLSQKTKNKNSQVCLDNLSPEIYMKKRIGINHKNVFNNLKNRIKRYEEDIQKQNDYDYKKAMKECEMKYIKEMKNKEKEKQIQEEHKKMEEKLKNMEEYRNNALNSRIKNIIQRQKKRNRNKQKSEKSFESNNTDLSIKERVEKINNDKIFKTLELYEAKLPLIN